MTLRELYQLFRNVLFLHGITRLGPENHPPEDSSFAERIIFAVRESRRTKLSTHSFTIGLDDRPNLYSPLGILLRNADVIAADFADTGLTASDLHLASLQFPNPNFEAILLNHGPKYNEFVVGNAVPLGIYIWDYEGQFSPEDVQNASVRLKLPVYILEFKGLFRTNWNAAINNFTIIPGATLTIHELLAENFPLSNEIITDE